MSYVEVGPWNEDKLNALLGKSITGRIGLVYGGRDWLARLIRVVTRSAFHHVIIDLGDGTCASAETNGMERKDLRDYPKVVWFTIGTEEQRRTIAWFGANEVQRNTAYNRPAFVLAGLADLGLVPRFLHQCVADWADEHGFTCSSLADTALEAAGIDLFEDQSPIYTSPADLARKLGAKVPTASPEG